MMRALIEGTIFRACERKVSKAGKEYPGATIKTGSGQEWQFVRIVAFPSTVIGQIEELQIVKTKNLQLPHHFA